MSIPPRSKGRVLVMDDEEALADLVATALREAGYEVRVAHGVSEAKSLIAQCEFDVALLDMHLPDGTGEDILLRLSDEGASTEAIMLTGDRDITSVVHAMKLGASDYLVKPTPLADLELAVGQARERHRLRTENLGLRARLQRNEPKTSIVTEDPGFLQVIATLDQLGPSELPVLIQGESGVGKELLARAIHDAGHRRMEPFIALDCATVPEVQIERELFGYERGAFDGALERKPGVFELADRGTLFLKGISEISPTVQPALLRVLKTSEFSRLGSGRAIRSHVRLVSSTNKDLAAARARGTLREDLYGQINGLTLRVPPLRDRPSDILPLSLHFLKSHGISRGISPRALEVLKVYSWPANVRELQMVIRRAGVLARGARIEPADLPFAQTDDGAS